MALNRNRGTTLVEVLVVIVVFLVGILAVVQIFPRGFQILTLTRKGAQANALARDLSERLKASPNELPELILPVGISGAAGDTGDARVTSGDLGPAGDRISSDGFLMRGNQVVGPWALHTGANRIRTIVGETRQVPAPRKVSVDSSLYGGLLIANFGPVDTAYPFLVSGNDLSRNPRPPSQLSPRDDISGANGMTYWETVDTLGDSDFYLDGLDSGDPAVYLPTGPSLRRYRFTLSVLVSRNGRPVRRTYRNLPLVNGVPTELEVPATTLATGREQLGYPLVRVPLGGMISGAIASGDTYQSIFPDSIRVKRGYNVVGTNQAFTSDPFEVKLLSGPRGVLLFNPAGYSSTVDGTDGRQPLQATLDYTVADWRILHEEFRLTSSDNGQLKLSIGSLKGAVSGPDGRQSISLGVVEPLTDADTSLAARTQVPASNHMVVTDLDTGGIVCEKDPGGSGPALISVNKSLGLVTFADAVPGGGVQVKILLPDGQTRDFDLQGRALRIYYMTRDEFAVQVLKPAASYSQTVGQPGPAEYYIGGTATSSGGVRTRIYFPRSDAGQKVTIGVVNYLDASNRPRQIVGQDFSIRFRQNEENPSIDLIDVDSSAARFDLNTIAARDVRGTSLTVRTLWNPDFFSLGSDPLVNLQRFDQWNRGTRRSTLQTYVSRGEASN